MKARAYREIDLPSSFGADMKIARENDTRSVSELSRAAGIARSTWYKIEAMEMDYVDADVLLGIIAVLDTPLGLNVADLKVK